MHTSVLLKEAIEGLDIKKGDLVVDGTLGGGGHSEEICKSYGEDITLFAFDKDSDAIDRSQKRLQKFKTKKVFFNESFENIKESLITLGVSSVDKIILDLGLSSFQLDSGGRGFSFRFDEPLLMTMKKDIGDEDLTAKDIVNTWKEESIRDILKGYGEERFAGRIARAIVEYRDKKEIETTLELSEIVRNAVPAFARRGKIHPATQTFQALRIAVNDELESLKRTLEKSFKYLNKNGRIAVITFHSLEDRIVKNFFKKVEDDDIGKRITKKPIAPSKEEIKNNPRSRSAKLRIVQKTI
jgi:16S rRNA (cytosine1402-N4)-methyltransferase